MTEDKAKNKGCWPIAIQIGILILGSGLVSEGYPIIGITILVLLGLYWLGRKKPAKPPTQEKPTPPAKPTPTKPKLPTATFTVNHQELTVELDASASASPNGAIVDYHWDLNDGSKMKLETPRATYEYAEPGKYRIKLTIKDEAGKKKKAVRTITLKTPNPIPQPPETPLQPKEPIPEPPEVPTTPIDERPEVPQPPKEVPAEEPVSTPPVNEPPNEPVEVPETPTEVPTTPQEPVTTPQEPVTTPPEEPQLPTTPVTPGTPDDPIPWEPEIPIDHVKPAVPVKLRESVKKLLEGDNPVQKEVLPGAIKDNRIALVQGRVLSSNRTAIAGVKVSALNKQDEGFVMTRKDGSFHMAINGGRATTLWFEKEGYLKCQRTFRVSWEGSAHLEEVVLIQEAPIVAAIENGKTTPKLMVAEPVEDQHGSRNHALYVPENVTFKEKKTTGEEAALTKGSLRMSEYTLGEDGPRAMPAELPPDSAYTYAIELAMDEAGTDSDVVFDQPVAHYVSNFLNMPIGTPVPVGYYDKKEAEWVPAKSGRVIGVIAIEENKAVLDVEGENKPATTKQLEELNIDQAELEQLATQYQPGDTLWRAQLTHFSPWDLNFPATPPDDAVDPDFLPPDWDPPRGRDCEREAYSSIGVQHQTLSETIPIVGTRYTMSYHSERVPGRKSAYEMEIHLSGATIPDSVKRIELEVLVAGTLTKKSWEPTTELSYTFTWNGKNFFGEPVQGRQMAEVRVGYVYPGVYRVPEGQETAFGLPGGAIIPDAPTDRADSVKWRMYTVPIGVWDARSQGMGGWMIDQLPTFDPSIKKVMQGGTIDHRKDYVLEPLIGRGEWSEEEWPTGDMNPLETAFDPSCIAVAADNTLYATTKTGFLLRMEPGGKLERIAGKETDNASTHPQLDDVDDGALALETHFGVLDVALGPKEEIYLMDKQRLGIWLLDEEGKLWLKAGMGNVTAQKVDEIKASEVSFNKLMSIKCGPEGAIFVVDQERTIDDEIRSFIFRIGKNGILTRVAGNIYGEEWKENISAKEAVLGEVHDLMITSKGKMVFHCYPGWYWKEEHFPTDDYLCTIEGGILRFAAQDGNALQAFKTPASLSQRAIFHLLGDCDDDDNLLMTQYVGSGYGLGIMTVSPGGTMQTIHVENPWKIADTSWDLNFRWIDGYSLFYRWDFECMAVGPDKSIYLGIKNRGVYRLNAKMGEEWKQIGDGQGGQQQFEQGKYTGTQHYANKQPLTQVSYDSNDLPIAITDDLGRATVIERNPEGKPLAIVSPTGIRTELALNEEGWLTHVKAPEGVVYKCTYNEGGLLTSFTDPEEHTTKFEYNEKGRLIADINPAGKALSIALEKTNDGHQITETLPSGKAITYTEDGGTGGLSDCTGCKGVTYREWEGAGREINYEDGTKVEVERGMDPLSHHEIIRAVRVSKNDRPLLSASYQRTAETNKKETTKVWDELTLMGQKIRITHNIDTSMFEEKRQALKAYNNGQELETNYLDEAGRIEESYVPGGPKTSLSYNEHGLIGGVAFKREKEMPCSFEYDEHQRLAAIKSAMGEIIRYEYNLLGQVVKEYKNGSQWPTCFEYNKNGLLTKLTTPGKGVYRFEYDQLKNRTAIHYPSSGAIKYAYDDDKRLVKVTRKDGRTIAMDYDEKGRLQMMTTEEGIFTCQYNGEENAPTTLEGPERYTNIEVVLDASMNCTYRMVGEVNAQLEQQRGGGYFLFNSDEITSIGGMEKVVKKHQNGMITHLGPMEYQWNKALQVPDTVTLHNMKQQHQYSSSGLLEGITHQAAAAALVAWKYEYDGLGRISKMVEELPGQTVVTEYAYEEGRLQQVTENGQPIWKATYDANANRTQLTRETTTVEAEYNEEDQLIQWDAFRFEYSPDGEITASHAPEGTTTYQYNTFGQLTTVRQPDGTTIEYLLDAESRRIGKKVNGKFHVAYLYDTDKRLVAELDETGAVISEFFYGIYSHVPTCMRKGEQWYRFILDHVGSPRWVVESTTGEVAQALKYDVEGNMLEDTNPGFQPFGFAGGLYDQHTHCLYFNQRDYNPAIGRWMSVDAAGFDSEEVNHYNYCKQDPVNYIDPSGKWVQIAIMVGKVLIDAAITSAVGAAINATRSAATEYYNTGTVTWRQTSKAVTSGLIAGPYVSGVGPIGEYWKAGWMPGGLSKMLYAGGISAFVQIMLNLISNYGDHCEHTHLGPTIIFNMLGQLGANMVGSKIPAGFRSTLAQAATSNIIAQPSNFKSIENLHRKHILRPIGIDGAPLGRWAPR